jgi:hypothetical protein
MAWRSVLAFVLAFALILVQSASLLAQPTPSATRQVIDTSGAQFPLLVVEQHRASIVQRIVATWGDAPAQQPGSSRMTAERLSDALYRLRADRLFAASLAGSYATVRAVLAGAEGEQYTRPTRTATKALGHTTQDLTYAPLTPCRTNIAGGHLRKSGG